jgi:hypothetical protein
MAQKEQQRSVYRSMQGREVDMNKLINTNEMTVAVGNAKVNARGDELGPGGQIIRKREEVLAAAIPTQTIPDQLNVRPQPTPAPTPAAAPAPAVTVTNTPGTV